MEDAVYWIWLQEVLGIGSPLVDQVLENIGTARQVFDMERSDLEKLRIFPAEKLERIKTTSLEHAKKMLERANKLGCKVVTPEHSDYPPAFAHIYCKPCVLYVLGNLCCSAPLSITIVGTRKSSDEGVCTAQEISRDLASIGCQVVSGLAVGIDQSAHQGALSVHGRTVGVMACGMKVPYPLESSALKRRILDEGGALFSEFPFECEPLPKNFYIRNRLLSGLSQGTLVVQAARRSGALITAKYAFDNNRDVFAIPGSIYDPSMEGCNQLIKTYGTLVTNAYEIIETYLDCFSEEELARIGNCSDKTARMSPQMAQSTSVQPLRNANPASSFSQKPSKKILETMELTQDARKIYEALSDQLQNYDTLIECTNLPANILAAGLTELEMFSLIEAAPGRRYKRI